MSGRSAIWWANRCWRTRPRRRARWWPRSSPGIAAISPPPPFAPASVAAICFTEPEIVSAGLSPDEARAVGEEIVTGMFPFSASGRALTLEAADDGGFVRIVARKSDQRVLGVQAVGRGVAELAGEFAHALAMGAVLDDIAGTIHVHPTLGEALGEAALLALGRGLHI